MIDEHWFWALLTAACVLWYSTVTVYVAIRGVFDIRSMLARLRNGRERGSRAKS
jgi:hypothetical protein